MIKIRRMFRGIWRNPWKSEDSENEASQEPKKKRNAQPRSADLGILNFAATVPMGTTYRVTPQQMSARRIPMTWFCEMANLILGDNVELLEYHHLIANQATRATWKHSYRNKIGQLAQGMPGCNSGTNTIVFIKKNQVPQIEPMTWAMVAGAIIKSPKIFVCHFGFLSLGIPRYILR